MAWNLEGVSSALLPKPDYFVRVRIPIVEELTNPMNMEKWLRFCALSKQAVEASGFRYYFFFTKKKAYRFVDLVSVPCSWIKKAYRGRGLQVFTVSSKIPPNIEEIRDSWVAVYGRYYTVLDYNIDSTVLGSHDYFDRDNEALARVRARNKWEGRRVFVSEHEKLEAVSALYEAGSPELANKVLAYPLGGRKDSEEKFNVRRDREWKGGQEFLDF